MSDSTFVTYEGLMFGPASINSIHMLSIAYIAARGNLLLFYFLNQIVQNLCLSSLKVCQCSKVNSLNSTPAFVFPYPLFEKRVERNEGREKRSGCGIQEANSST